MSERTDSLSAEVLQEFFPDDNLRTLVELFVDGVSRIDGVGRLVAGKFHDGTIRFYAVWDVNSGDHDKITRLCGESFLSYARDGKDFLVIHFTQEGFQAEENSQHFKSIDSGTIWERLEEAE